LIKVKILKALNLYNKANDVLNDCLEWHPDKKETITQELESIKHCSIKDKLEEETIYRKMFSNEPKESSKGQINVTELKK